MKTILLILGVALVGTLVLVGAHRRAECLRSAYRIHALSERLATIRNENEWLRAEIDRRSTPRALEAAASKHGVDLPVKDTPLVVVPQRPVREAPGQ